MTIQKKSWVSLACATVFFLCSCAPFLRGARHGVTDRALDHYYLIADMHSHFGERRLRVDRDFYRNTYFDQYIRQHGNPDMILEYKADNKDARIKLFYVKTDSAFVFGGYRERCNCLNMLGAEKINLFDQTQYRKLAADNYIR